MEGEESDEIVPIEVDPAGIGARVFTLPVKPGQFDGFEAAAGALLLGRHPRESVGEEVWPVPPMGTPGTRLERFDVRAGKSTPLLESPVTAWNTDAKATTVVTWDGQSMMRLPIDVTCPKDTEASQSMPRWMFAAASLRPGTSSSRPRGAPDPTKTAS